MVDVHVPSVRSKNMRAIRGKDTKPELFVRKALHAKGFRFRVNVKTLLGTPDIVLPKYKTLIFVHGCFWHGHQCHLFKVPKTRTEFWLAKISENIKRDEKYQLLLQAEGWRLGIVWECAIKGSTRVPTEGLLDRLGAWIIAIDRPYAEFVGED